MPPLEGSIAPHNELVHFGLVRQGGAVAAQAALCRRLGPIPWPDDYDLTDVALDLDLLAAGHAARLLARLEDHVLQKLAKDWLMLRRDDMDISHVGLAA